MFNNILDHPKTTVAGLLIAIVSIAGVLSQQGITLGNAGTGTVVALVGAIATALLGLLAKDPGSGGSNTGNKLGVFLLVCLLAFSVGARGQVAAEATASAINYQGAWTAGTEQSQSFPLVYWGAQKGNIFSLGAREILNPGVFNVYGALGSYQPDISKLLAKTTFNPDQVNLSLDVVGGAATLQNGSTVPALEGRLNLKVAITPNTAFTGGYAGGGLIGKDRFGVVSAGFVYDLFRPKTSQSLAKQRFNKKYALKHNVQ